MYAHVSVGGSRIPRVWETVVYALWALPSAGGLWAVDGLSVGWLWLAAATTVHASCSLAPATPPMPCLALLPTGQSHHFGLAWAG